MLCYFIKSHFELCCILAFLASLVVLFITTAVDTYEKEKEEEEKVHEEELELRKKIRDEYQRIHKLKKKHELLKKIESQEQITDSDMDTPPEISITKKEEPESTVHFSYLNRHTTDEEDEKRSNL